MNCGIIVKPPAPCKLTAISCKLHKNRRLGIGIRNTPAVGMYRAVDNIHRPNRSPVNLLTLKISLTNLPILTKLTSHITTRRSYRKTSRPRQKMKQRLLLDRIGIGGTHTIIVQRIQHPADILPHRTTPNIAVRSGCGGSGALPGRAHRIHGGGVSLPRRSQRPHHL